jgi:hypothetical protein
LDTSQIPVDMANHRVGVREITILLVCSVFALMMLDLGRLAIISGWAGFAMWVYWMTRASRPTWKLTAFLGIALAYSFFWWPEQGWWHEAIALMWVGVAMIAFALFEGLRLRTRSS